MLDGPLSFGYPSETSTLTDDVDRGLTKAREASRPSTRWTDLYVWSAFRAKARDVWESLGGARPRSMNKLAVAGSVCDGVDKGGVVPLESEDSSVWL